MPRELPTGIVATETGYRTFQWVPDPTRPDGRIVSKRWKADAALKDMIAWREEQRALARRRRSAPTSVPIGKGFVADAERYLELVRGMPSFDDRRRDILAWCVEFGEADRHEVATPARIRAARDRWRREGPKRVLEKAKGEPARWVLKPLPLSASAVNHRLRALENLFTLLDGKAAPNPVREVDECDEPAIAPKGQTFALGYEVLAHMPDYTSPKKGGTHEAGSLSRVRFETMLVTGLTPKQLGQLQETAVDWSTPSFLPPRRLKGRRARRQRARQQPKARPMMAAAVPVLRRFFAMGANRPFSQTSLGQSVKRAIRAANVVRASRGLPLIPETLTPYELTRHTFGTEVYRLTENLKLVQRLLGHSDSRQSERYAWAAIEHHQVAALEDLSKVARRARHLTTGKVSPRKSTGPDRTGRRAAKRIR